MKQLVVVIVIVLAVAGCGNVKDYSGELEDLANRSVCCSIYADMPFRDFKKLTSGRKFFNEKCPVYLFDGEKSFFQAFELDGSKIESLDISVVAYIVPSDPTYFHPRFLFLNQEKKRISVVDVDLPLRINVLGDQVVEGSVEVPGSARYVVIYSKPVGSSSFYTEGGGVVMGLGGMPLDVYQYDYKVTNRHRGTLKIKTVPSS